jgi:transcriptional regulator with XRE-family HTH domain
MSTVLALNNSEVNQSRYIIEDSWPMEKKILCNLLNDGETCKKVGDVIGINRSTVSQYANGKLGSGIERLEQALKEYFIRLGKWPEENKASTPSEFKQNVFDIGIIPTKDQARVMGVCQRAQTQHELCVLVGVPGTGKTKITGEYRKSHANVFIVTCTRSSKKKTILRKTAEAIGIESYGSSGDLEMRIAKSLLRKHEDCLIIYDEADYMNFDTLESIRGGIFDEVEKNDGKLGILLCGNEKLAEDILMYAEERKDYERLRDRIGHFQKLYGLGELEAEKFLAGVNCTVHAKSDLITIGVNRGTRQLMMALKRLLDVTKGKVISSDLVKELGQIVLSFNA